MDLKEPNYIRMCSDVREASRRIQGLLYSENDNKEFIDMMSSMISDLKCAIENEEETDIDKRVYDYAKEISNLARKTKASSLLTPQRKLYYAGYLTALAELFCNRIQKRNKDELDGYFYSMI